MDAKAAQDKVDEAVRVVRSMMEALRHEKAENERLAARIAALEEHLRRMTSGCPDGQ